MTKLRLCLQCILSDKNHFPGMDKRERKVNHFVVVPEIENAKSFETFKMF